jgi:putative membrane protein
MLGIVLADTDEQAGEKSVVVADASRARHDFFSSRDSELDRETTMRLLLNWILSALAVWIVSRVVPGIYVSGPVAALIAALAIGFINATLGVLLKILTFPLTLATLGIFWFVINALMLKFASALVPGFQVHGFIAAFLGAIVLSLVNMLLKWLVYPAQDRQ